MTISLSDAGKRFNRDWIFRHLDYHFHSGIAYAIIGPNGSGKSTLLQVVSGAMLPSEGKLQYDSGEKKIDPENIYQLVSICAPYLEVMEEMTLYEFFAFHTRFKKLLPSIELDMIIDRIGLANAKQKQIRNYSSGMRQRVKLAQCIFSDTDIVLLDEPCTNLDKAGIELYHSLIDTYCKDRVVVVSSNDEVEYNFCEEKIFIQDYK